MRTLIAAAALAAGSLTTAMPAAAADLGFSISIHEPGLYGRIDFGHRPSWNAVSPVYGGWYRPDPVVVWAPPRWQRGHEVRHDNRHGGHWDERHGERWDDRDGGRWDERHRGDSRDHGRQRGHDRHDRHGR